MGRIAVIGSGFSGLSAACFAAKAGHAVTVYEKNSSIGGRCRFYREQGFGFDMGPSWYWMPDVFEKFFKEFGKHPSDYYDLVELDPGFQMFFGNDETVKIPARLEDLYTLFEQIEPGSADKLRKFLAEGKFKYEVGMQQLVYKPAYSWFEFMNYEVISGVAKSNVFRSVRSYVRSYFTDPRLVALMEFPVLFLGAMPQQIPALYSLMNYAALNLGTWYPMGGMHKIIEGMASLAESLGVEIRTNSEISKIVVNTKAASHLQIGQQQIAIDGVIASSDYHHTDRVLLGSEFANYPESYWSKKTFAPSCLIFYIGVNKRVKKLLHHNLFFDSDLDKHAQEIYAHPEWPSDPLFYVCCPSKTDPTVAPEGMENLFVLIPIATGLKDTPELREEYFQKVMKRMELITADTIREHIVYRKDYCVNDFVNDYHAYGGNAYGLANTLSQTAVWKPSMRNKKVKNLFYTGQLTVPGPGIPPAIISGQIAAEQISKTIKPQLNERAV